MMDVLSNLAFAGFGLLGAWRIWRRDEETARADHYAVEKRVFKLSLAWLFLHFTAILIEATPWADALARLIGWEG